MEASLVTQMKCCDRSHCVQTVKQFFFFFFKLESRKRVLENTFNMSLPVLAERLQLMEQPEEVKFKS